MTAIQKELESIRRENGILRPEDVVAFAVNPQTALHSRFNWDDGEAAHQYRLQQARQVIRVTVHMLPVVNRETRVYVSLKSDRYEKGGGYRPIVNVLTNEDQRAELLGQALEEMQLWRAKYRRLNELLPIFAALDAVAARGARKAALT